MRNYIKTMWASYEVFCRILLLLMTCLVIIFVFMRYFIGLTFVWAEESITMLFISTTYFGAVLGMKYDEHISIDYFVEKVKIKEYIFVLNDVLVFGLQIVLLTTSLNWITQVGNVLTNGLRVPIKIFYFMMPISAFLIGLYCFFSILRRVSSLIAKSKNTKLDTQDVQN